MRFKLLLLLLILSASACAVDFHVFVEPSQQSVHLNSSASFDVEVRSNFPKDQAFEVYTPEVSWRVDVGGAFVVPKNGTVTKKLTVEPLQNVNPGRHTLPVLFKAVGSDIVRKVVVLDVNEALPPGTSYLPSLRGTLHLEPSIDPREPAKVRLVVENQNKKRLDDVEIKLRSEFINGDFTTSFDPLEEKTLTYDIRLAPSTPPRKDTLAASLLVEEDKQYQFDLIPASYKILSYGEVVEEREESSGFLSRAIIIDLKNEGNDEIGHVLKVPAGFWSGAFVSSSLPGRIVDGELTWDLRLEPGEELTIDVDYNYQPVFWIILVVLIAVVIYYYYRSPIVIRKRAKILRTKEEGISELKVVIEVHNRGMRHVRNVKVMDMVPHVAKLVEGPAHGLAPSKIVPHEHKGTLVKWDVGLIEPREQRILTYTAKCRFTVLGSMTLPVTVAKFVVGNRSRQVASNRCSISIS